MTTTHYDAEILQAHADELYRQAQWIVILTAAKYAFFGFVIAGVLLYGTAAINGATRGEFDSIVFSDRCL